MPCQEIPNYDIAKCGKAFSTAAGSFEHLFGKYCGISNLEG